VSTAAIVANLIAAELPPMSISSHPECNSYFLRPAISVTCCDSVSITITGCLGSSDSTEFESLYYTMTIANKIRNNYS